MSTESAYQSAPADSSDPAQRQQPVAPADGARGALSQLATTWLTAHLPPDAPLSQFPHDGSTTTHRAMAYYRLADGKIAVNDVTFVPDLLQVLGPLMAPPPGDGLKQLRSALPGQGRAAVPSPVRLDPGDEDQGVRAPGVCAAGSHGDERPSSSPDSREHQAAALERPATMSRDVVRHLPGPATDGRPVTKIPPGMTVAAARRINPAEDRNEQCLRPVDGRDGGVPSR